MKRQKGKKTIAEARAIKELIADPGLSAERRVRKWLEYRGFRIVEKQGATSRVLRHQR